MAPATSRRPNVAARLRASYACSPCRRVRWPRPRAPGRRRAPPPTPRPGPGVGQKRLGRPSAAAGVESAPAPLRRSAAARSSGVQAPLRRSAGPRSSLVRVTIRSAAAGSSRARGPLHMRSASQGSGHSRAPAAGWRVDPALFSLSCAYGVSCRARAERVALCRPPRAEALCEGRRFAPRPHSRPHLVPPFSVSPGSGTGDSAVRLWVAFLQG
jgi:hypothetical protein